MKDILVETLKCQLSLAELQIQADRWPVGTKDPKTGLGIGGQFKPTGGSGSVKSKESEDKETRDFIKKYNEQKNNTSAQDEAAFKEFQANNQAKFMLLNTAHVAARMYEQIIPLNTDVPFLESFQKGDRKGDETETQARPCCFSGYIRYCGYHNQRSDCLAKDI